MMDEERIKRDIVKLEQAKMQLFAQLSQTEGAIATLQAVLDPPEEPEAVAASEVIEVKAEEV